MTQTRAWGNTDIHIPVVGQGTWQMERDDRAACLEALRTGLDLGLVHIDTAELYGHGDVEELVGEALQGRRDEVFLVSKVLPSNASRRGTIEACERSLRRLKTDHLDGYLLHWPGSHPLEDTIAAFEELVDTGKIRTWGVSNFDEAELDRAVEIAGPGRVACNQVLYHLRERNVEHAVQSACERHGATLVAYSPFGSGSFPAHQPDLARIAADRGVTSYAVALAYLARTSSVATIPKAASADHVRANAQALELTLDAAELDRLDRAFPRRSHRPGVPSL